MSLGIIQQNSGWFFMLQCQAVLGVGHKAGGKLVILQDPTTDLAQMNCGGTGRQWKFYFNDLEIIRQMTRYFCDSNCNIICLLERSHNGEGAFCLVTLVTYVLEERINQI